MEPSLYRRPVTATERELADERIRRSGQALVIDADECAGRLAHLASVRTVGELAAIVDDLPDLGDLRARGAAPIRPSAAAMVVQPTVAGPTSAGPTVAGPTVAQPTPRRGRLPVTSPGRADGPPPDLPPGPYGHQFVDADPRVLSRVVTRVVPTAWGPSWQTTVVPQTNRYAVSSLVLGIAGVFCGIPAPIGIVTGYLALVQIRTSDVALQRGTVAAVGEQPQTGRGLAKAGLIVSSCVTGLYLVLLVVVIVMALRRS